MPSTRASPPPKTRVPPSTRWGVPSRAQILMVHGVLHLLGYDHEDDTEAHEEMAAAESKLLTRLGWAGSGLIAAAEEAE